MFYGCANLQQVSAQRGTFLFPAWEVISEAWKGELVQTTATMPQADV